MQGQRWAWLEPFRTILTSAAIWVFLAVPVAAGISFLAVSLLIIYAVKEMVATAAVLGAVQGLCLFLMAKWSRPVPGSSPENPNRCSWFGALFGGALGLLGFVPVYSYTSISGAFWLVIIFLIAAISGGAVAGMVCCGGISARLRCSVALGRSFVLASLFMLTLAVADYKMYWHGLDDQHPTPLLALTNLSAGDARGTAWSGCYDYSARISDGSGGEGGILSIRQQDGGLNISDPDGASFRGGVDRNGHFRAGAKTGYDGYTIRILWTGTFGMNSFTATKRDTWVGHWKINTMKMAGTAKRVSCGS
jgi:hypothetical protein